MTPTTTLLPIRLKQVRDDAGMTQEELGHRLGRSKNSISQFERGSRRPDAQTLVQYARLFSVSTDYLLGLCELRRPARENLLRMQGDSMCTLRVRDGDLLRLRPQSFASSGSLVLAEYQQTQRVMFYLRQNGHHNYYLDLRTLEMLSDPPLRILGVVESAEYIPSPPQNNSATGTSFMLY